VAHSGAQSEVEKRVEAQRALFATCDSEKEAVSDKVELATAERKQIKVALTNEGLSDSERAQLTQNFEESTQRYWEALTEQRNLNDVHVARRKMFFSGGEAEGAHRPEKRVVVLSPAELEEEEAKIRAAEAEVKRGAPLPYVDPWNLAVE